MVCGNILGIMCLCQIEIVPIQLNITKNHFGYFFDTSIIKWTSLKASASVSHTENSSAESVPGFDFILHACFL